MNNCFWSFLHNITFLGNTNLIFVSLLNKHTTFTWNDTRKTLLAFNETLQTLSSWLLIGSLYNQAWYSDFFCFLNTKPADYSDQYFSIPLQVFKRNCGGSLPKNCNNWQRVANELKSKYQSTINKTQQTNINSTSQSNLRPTYQDPSPDYCVRNLTVGSPGLEGRVCGNSGTITSQCRSLCEQCGLTLLREDRSPRNCKDCPEITSVTVCRKKKIVTGKRSVEQSPVQMIGLRKHFLSLGTDV